MPIRIQSKRTKGWKMPPNTVSVTRPGKWGNPYKIGARDPRTGGVFDAASAVERFRNSLVLGRLAVSEETIKRELRGKNLACFCALDQPCHADVLLEIANA